MSGTLHLTEREQLTLTIALDLDAQGFTEAAAYLRGTIASLRLVNWHEPTQHIDWSELFRIHREHQSAPPAPVEGLERHIYPPRLGPTIYGR